MRHSRHGHVTLLHCNGMRIWMLLITEEPWVEASFTKQTAPKNKHYLRYGGNVLWLYS